MPQPAPRQWLWLALALALAFAIPAVFAGLLHWPRRLHTVPVVLLESALLWGWWRSGNSAWRPFLARRWIWGMGAGAAAGVFTVSNVLGQPSSQGADGWMRAWDLLWLGVAYGAVDAAFLTVLPVAAVWRGMSGEDHASWPRRLGIGALAMAASLAITAAYHLGYPEFRGGALAGPLIGNAVFTLAYLLTSSPLAPVIGHVAMHIAAVWFAFDTAVQLPPHY